jgi:thiamine biosynthesis protein ThiC
LQICNPHRHNNHHKTTKTPQHEIEASNDQHQDSEEEIEVVIEDEFTRLHQENERLWLKQEHMAKRRAAMQWVQIMQQQIDKKRARQA